MLVGLIPCLMAPISEESPIKMEKRFLNTSHPKKVHRVYASPDGSTKWSDLAGRVIVPCPVFTVAVLMEPSSIGDSSDRPSDPCRIGFMYQHNISHSWFLLCVVPLSTGVQSGEVFLSSPVLQLRCEVLLIPPSADQENNNSGEQKQKKHWKD
ncbi:hypothetical protein T12_2940 [Trichinella patagoniensis]|uniref:Uncharacterized protein n=1 Tax=Trichinella patagoniensis TaxID=990121 RepID=A0A0V0ZTP0_9BILA|nr:hypothetical protein T12_2940 [Trichinella patagoniensis]